MTTGSGSPTKILFLAGWQRSGSTLLQRMLGQIDGVFPAGELWYIWEQGLIENRLCGCGSRFRDCAFWAKVFDRAFGGMPSIEADRMMQAVRSGSRTRYLPRYWTASGRRSLAAGLDYELDAVRRLYAAILAISGRDYLIDSSKSPGYANLLSIVRGVEVYVIHLVRDPRGVAYSWQRRKPQIDTGNREHMDRTSAAKSSLLWNVWNLASEHVHNCGPDHYLRLRYEDLMARPGQEIERIAEKVGLSGRNLDFINGKTVHLTPTHTVSGNPNRFQAGDINLSCDEEWKDAMSGFQRNTVTLLTRPLLGRYGYRPSTR